MATFDYGASAELFPTRSRMSRRQPVSYKRFDTAAEAIRYAIEDMPPELLVGAYLEVEEERFDGNGIRNLYVSDAYPLPRRGTLAPPVISAAAAAAAAAATTPAATASPPSAPAARARPAPASRARK